jgi:hypothetical protein
VSERPTPTETTTHRLRTVTGNRWPRKCACGCDQKIPRDPEIRFVVDFGASRPYPAYIREHSPDFPGRKPSDRNAHPGDTCPGFVPASLLMEASKAAGGAGSGGYSFSAESFVPRDPAHSDEESSPSPQAGRAWASGQLVFNAGQFESARSGFADYAGDGETGQQLRNRVNRVILEDLEQKVIALHQLHEKLRDRLGGPSFGNLVARAHPIWRSGWVPTNSEIFMFEFRLRILEVGPREYAGVIDGFPDFLVTRPSIPQTERDLVAVLFGQLRGLLHYDRHHYWLDEFPAVRVARLHLSCLVG